MEVIGACLLPTSLTMVDGIIKRTGSLLIEHNIDFGPNRGVMYVESSKHLHNASLKGFNNVNFVVIQAVVRDQRPCQC